MRAPVASPRPPVDRTRSVPEITARHNTFATPRALQQLASFGPPPPPTHTRGGTGVARGGGETAAAKLSPLLFHARLQTLVRGTKTLHCNIINGMRCAFVFKNTPSIRFYRTFVCKTITE